MRRYDLDDVMFPVYPCVWCEPAERTDAIDQLATEDIIFPLVEKAVH